MVFTPTEPGIDAKGRIAASPASGRKADYGSRTEKKDYSCWLCGKACGNTADYLLHLQAHKDAIERQPI